MRLKIRIHKIITLRYTSVKKYKLYELENGDQEQRYIYIYTRWIEN